MKRAFTTFENTGRMAEMEHHFGENPDWHFDQRGNLGREGYISMIMRHFNLTRGDAVEVHKWVEQAVPHLATPEQRERIRRSGA